MCQQCRHGRDDSGTKRHGVPLQTDAQRSTAPRCLLRSIPCQLSPLQSTCDVDFSSIRDTCDKDPNVMAQQAALATAGILSEVTLAYFFASYYCIPPVRLFPPKAALPLRTRP